MTLPGRLATPTLDGLWDRCWKAMARAGPDGWRTVTIRMPVADDAERRAAAGLLGRRLRPGTAATQVRLADLDALLVRADADWGLAAVVEAARGPLPDRRGDERARRSAVRATREQALAATGDTAWARAWFDDLDDGMLARLHGRDELHLVGAAASILAELPADGLPLPVLASRTTGDTKALSGTPLAGLVLRGLARRLDEDVPTTAEGRRRLWEAAGVVPDDLSSQVLVIGLTGAGGTLGRWLTEAAVEGLPFRVTLQQLTRHPVEVRDPGPVFVSENPAVLRSAAERLGGRCPPLVCTEGRPSVACSMLLRALAAGGCELRYHGDFDWPGLRIASAVLGEAGAVPWRFGASDYLAAVGMLGTDRMPLRGTPAATPWDPDLAPTMRTMGAVVYEEDVLDTLLDDLGSVGGQLEWT